MLVDGELFLLLERNSLTITTWPERFRLMSSSEQEEVWHMQMGGRLLRGIVSDLRGIDSHPPSSNV